MTKSAPATVKRKKQLFYKLLAKVPKGEATSYGALARAVKTSPRVIGHWCATNPHAPQVPCHRVVKSDGTTGGFTHPQGIKKKIEMLEKEGFRIKKGKIVDFQSKQFQIQK